MWPRLLRRRIVSHHQRCKSQEPLGKKFIRLSHSLTVGTAGDREVVLSDLVWILWYLRITEPNDLNSGMLFELCYLFIFDFLKLLDLLIFRKKNVGMEFIVLIEFDILYLVGTRELNRGNHFYTVCFFLFFFSIRFGLPVSWSQFTILLLPLTPLSLVKTVVFLGGANNDRGGARFIGNCLFLFEF